mgnify:CR=1 FL=1
MRAQALPSAVMGHLINGPEHAAGLAVLAAPHDAQPDHGP